MCCVYARYRSARVTIVLHLPATHLLDTQHRSAPLVLDPRDVLRLVRNVPYVDAERRARRRLPVPVHDGVHLIAEAVQANELHHPRHLCEVPRCLVIHGVRGLDETPVAHHKLIL